MHGNDSTATSRRNQMPQLRLASYNIHLGIGRDGEFNPARIARVIEEIDADVFALQEVLLGAALTAGPDSVNASPERMDRLEPTNFDMLGFLAARCGLYPIAGPTLVGAKGQYGNAILTRLHPVAVHRWDLTVGRHEPRGAIDVVLRHDAGRLRIVATHLGLLPGERRRQIRHLLQLVGKDSRLPTVLLGDLNEWFLWGRPLRWMHRHFQSTPAPATFPSGHPFLALDRIWVEPRRALRNISAHRSAIARVASDHLPIVADIEFGDFAADVAALRRMGTREALSA